MIKSLTKPFANNNLFNFCVLLSVFNVSMQAQNYMRDVKMGDRAAKQVEQEMGIYRHDSLEKVINAIGQKLVNSLEKKPREFNFIFHLVDTDIPNAFALPGGHIYVTRGILPLVQNEDELAGIIGHEIIHVVNRHSVKQFNREIVPAVIKIPGNIINAVTFSHLGNLLNVPIDLISSPFIANYSRKHETEADVEGIKLAKRAGYHPEALAQVLNRLSKGIEAITGQKEKKSYLADHPYTPKRVANINKLLANDTGDIKSSNIYTSKDKFLEQFNGLCYGSNPKNGAFIDSLFVQPELKFSMIMPSDWNTVNEPSVVAASPKTGDAIVSLSLSDGEKTTHDLGIEMTNKINKSSNSKIEFAGDTVINSIPGYLLRFNSLKKNKIVVMELIWLNYNNQVYQLSGFSYPEKRNLTAQALRSFKSVTLEQIAKVKIYEVDIAKVNGNETLDSFSKRTNNKLKNELTLIYNDLSESSKLTVNEQLKIVDEKPFKLK